MAAEKVFIGYNFCGAIHGAVIPQRLQNLCIRDYAQGKGVNIAFSVSEYTDAQRALILFAQFEIKDRPLSGFVFFSLLLLPNDQSRRKEFYERAVAAGMTVYFALEDLVLKTRRDAEELERLYRISVDQRLIENRKSVLRKPVGQEVELITPLHVRTKRDYVGRVTQADKGECAAIARQWGKDYWDGDRKHGYGGYSYDGRWVPVAEKMIARYGLSNNSSILDVGCGKGFLLYELKKLLPGSKVRGLDISDYGIEHSKPEIREHLTLGNCNKLPFADNEFDFVYSVMTFHNLYLNDLFVSVRELQRVSRCAGYIGLESYRNEKEKANLLYWQLTCEAFFTPKEWVWLYEQCGFTGDYEFFYFE